MSNLIFYVQGLIGLWIVSDGIISIRLYINARDETGKRTQSWLYDHSIRILRVLCGIAIIAIGAWGIYEGN